MTDKNFASALFCVAYNSAGIKACIEYDGRPQADAALCMAIELGFRAAVRRVRFHDAASFDTALDRMRTELLAADPAHSDSNNGVPS